MTLNFKRIEGISERKIARRETNSRTKNHLELLGRPVTTQSLKNLPEQLEWGAFFFLSVGLLCFLQQHVICQTIDSVYTNAKQKKKVYK